VKDKFNVKVTKKSKGFLFILFRKERTKKSGVGAEGAL